MNSADFQVTPRPRAPRRTTCDRAPVLRGAMSSGASGSKAKARAKDVQEKFLSSLEEQNRRAQQAQTQASDPPSASAAGGGEGRSASAADSPAKPGSDKDLTSETVAHSEGGRPVGRAGRSGDEATSPRSGSEPSGADYSEDGGPDDAKLAAG